MKFASKYLKYNKVVKRQLLIETFIRDTRFNEEKLEISENWIKLKGVYIPKNFIIGTFETSQGTNTNDGRYLHFVLITGEYSFNYEMYGTGNMIEEDLLVLKSILPSSIITDTSTLFGWCWRHNKILRNYYKLLVKEKGINYLLNNKVDFYKMFSMDGIMSYEIRVGSKVDIICDNDKETGKLTQGHVKKLISVYDDKKGCKVIIEENNLCGRVKKVYGKRIKPIEVDTREVDDSAEYFTENPNECERDISDVVTTKKAIWRNRLIVAICLLVVILAEILASYFNINI